MKPRIIIRHRFVGMFSTHLHVYVWWLKRGTATGWHVKKRRRDGLWRHLRLRLAEPPMRRIKDATMLTWELDSWLTKQCRSSKDTTANRIGMKSFIRFKVGIGGVKAINPRTVQNQTRKQRRALRLLVVNR